MRLNPFISEVFNSPVWRMEIDETTGMLFLELRDTADKQVSFAAVDLENGTVSFKNLAMPERWLTGLEAGYQGILLLHGYHGESVPVHKGLFGIDGITGQTLWSDYNITFDSLTPVGPAVFDARIQPKKLFLIDVNTGLRTGTYQASQAIDSHSSIQTPQMLDAEQVNGLLNGLQPYANVVHYLSHDNFRIVSLHALIGGVLTQHLYVWDDKQQLIFEDIINDNIQKLQPEAFISYKNKLIWLKNQSALKVLNL